MKFSTIIWTDKVALWGLERKVSNRFLLKNLVCPFDKATLISLVLSSKRKDKLKFLPILSPE